MEVIDVITADQDAPVFAAAKALSNWYWCVRQVPFPVADIRRVGGRESKLERLTRAMRRGLDGLLVEGGKTAGTPKIHRTLAIVDVITAFGPYRLVTTDSFEQAHQVSKKAYARYAGC